MKEFQSIIPKTNVKLTFLELKPIMNLFRRSLEQRLTKAHYEPD